LSPGSIPSSETPYGEREGHHHRVHADDGAGRIDEVVDRLVADLQRVRFSGLGRASTMPRTV
jgi:hypothetical protein